MSLLIRVLPLSTRDTVDIETPASSAMSFILIRLFMGTLALMAKLETLEEINKIVPVFYSSEVPDNCQISFVGTHFCSWEPPVKTR